MKDIFCTLIVGLIMFGAFSLLMRRYAGTERSLLSLSLAAHVVSGAALTPFMRVVLKGGDMLVYAEIGHALLDRLFRAPVDTAGVLGGLLIRSENPLPVPDYGLAHGSSGAMIAFTTIALFVTGGSLYAACVLVAGLSFFSKLRIYDVFREEFDATLRRRIVIATTLVPSVVFWSSGLIKEAFTTVGLGLLFKELHRFYRGRFSLGGLALAIVGLLLIVATKAYVLIPLGMAATASVLLVNRLGLKRLSTTARTFAAIFGVAMVFGAGLASSQYDPTNVVEEAARQQETGEFTSYAGSHYTLVKERSFMGQLAAVPLAFGTSLFRPFIFEARNAQAAANGLETLFFTVLVIQALRRGMRGYRLVRRQPILVFCAVFSVVMAVGVGIASTNLGTLSRYRMPMMPFLWVLVTVVASMKRVPSTGRKSPHIPARAIDPRRTSVMPGIPAS